MAVNTYKSPWMNDQLQTFRTSVRSFVDAEFLPHQSRWREQRRPDADAWLKAGKMGILVPNIPKEYGGCGGTIADKAIVREELAHAGVNFASDIQSIVAHYILAYGTDEQKKKFLPRLARGELVGAIAMTEPGTGSDLKGIQMTAIREGNEYVINGCKAFITNGSQASLICLAVKTNPAAPGPTGISLLLVEVNNLRGYRLGRLYDKVGMQGQDTSEFFFENARVPVSCLLGASEGKGLGQLMAQLPYERLLIAVRAVATAEQAVAITTKYVKERMAFGKPLMDFQNTRFKLAECKTKAHIGRVFIDSCIERFMAGQLDSATAAMAKYWLTETECHIVDECVQLHGGYGYITDSPIARMWTDSRVQRIYAGTNEIMKELIGWTL